MLGGVYCFFKFHKGSRHASRGMLGGLLNHLECVGIIKSPVELKRCERVFYLMELKKPQKERQFFFLILKKSRIKVTNKKKVDSFLILYPSLS